ncbi:hypothetical protein PVL29_003748 [Vitis rotundifolia]|uniref:Uncharacterized protein n=1 Tax=Vitis rotundifolia TaxID=103349 RepID=A0AA39AEW7_VITRO|nr:hypothetical protein PVL29_003748 [Vitis rotundifolia]
MQHKMQLQTMKKGGATMVEYLLKMKGIIDVLVSIGHIVSKNDQILHVLVGLCLDESLKFEDVATLLMAHETRLEQHHHNLVETDPLDINIATSQSIITPHSS